MLNLIPRPVHAILDYVYAGTALIAPKMFFFDGNDPARRVSQIAGAGALISGLTTRHEGGVIKKLPFNTHLKLDAASAVLLLFTPWLFGFSKNTRARNAIIGLALLELAVFLLSRPDRD